VNTYSVDPGGNGGWSPCAGNGRTEASCTKCRPDRGPGMYRHSACLYPVALLQHDTNTGAWWIDHRWKREGQSLSRKAGTTGSGGI